MTRGSELTKISLSSLSEGYWEVCNDYFDRDIYTAADMQRQHHGNCFTLSEFLCSKLVASAEIAATGVCIEVLPSRRNYHASSWVVLKQLMQVVRLDLLEENPTIQPQLQEAVNELKSLTDSPNDVLYISTALATTSAETIMKRMPISEAYEWPPADKFHGAVFLNAPLGIQTLHLLAQLGGTKRLLDISEHGATTPLPELPK